MLGGFTKAVKEGAGAVAKDVKLIGAGASEVSKGIQSGDMERVTTGLGTAARSKALTASGLGGPALAAAHFYQAAGAPLSPEIQEKLAAGEQKLRDAIVPDVQGLSAEEMGKMLAQRDDFSTATSDIFSAIDPFSVKGITPQEIQAAQAAQVADIGIGDPSQFLSQQADLASILQGQVAGTQPSLAQLQMNAERDRMLNQQAALAASMSGRALPAAQRQLMQQAATSGQQLAQQAGVLRAQEQQAAQQQLAQLLGTARGQDLQREGLGLTAAQANQQAALQTELANVAAQNRAAEQNAANILAAQTKEAELDLAAQTSAADITAAQQRAKGQMLTADRELASKEALEVIRQEQENKRKQAELEAQMKGAVIEAGAGGLTKAFLG